jgi:hypothetical protein
MSRPIAAARAVTKLTYRGYAELDDRRDLAPYADVRAHVLQSIAMRLASIDPESTRPHGRASAGKHGIRTVTGKRAPTAL